MAENKNEFETIDFDSSDQKDTNADLQKNIFSDFETEKENSSDESFKKEKDIFDKLSILLKVIQGVFVLTLVIFIMGFTYVKIQKSETFANNEFLTPICSFFNGDLEVDGTGCSSITYNKNFIENQVQEVSKEQAKLVFGILPIMYEKESFLNTKEIQFLISKSENKLKVLDIIEKFNYFLNEFTGFEKKKLQCSDFKIESSLLISMKCEAFSKGYTYNEIIGFSGNKNTKEDLVSGTSISIANSFINFIERNANKYFIVVDKQKVFESEEALGTDGYTNKTSFDLKLKIIF